MSIKIHGKDYVTVAERVEQFHTSLKDGKEQGSICTEIVSNTDKMVVVKAIVTIGEQEFTGHSQASWTEGPMKAVALENAETSAVGRALAFAGFSVVEGVASADEINKADFKI